MASDSKTNESPKEKRLSGSKSASDVEKRNKISLAYSMNFDDDSSKSADQYLFSEGVKREIKQNEVTTYYKKNRMPDTKLAPTYELTLLPGQTPLSQEFHLESNRERLGPDDEGLEDEDLTYADGVVRKKVVQTKRKSIIYDNIYMTKGEFVFPYRTYRPKIQVPFKGGGGQVPQAVVCERLHRLYRRTDINLVLQQLGIEVSDLIPPPNYAETNERFYQEVNFRNRVRINGVPKKDYISLQNKSFRESLMQVIKKDSVKPPHLHAMREESSDTYISSNSYDASHSSGSSESHDSFHEEEERKIHVHHKEDVHPFIKSKSPFGPMFPLPCFDNFDYDIKPPEEWMGLRWDWKERKHYPLPGKAFLPLPSSSKRHSVALSETIAAADHLLTSSSRLYKMLHWLLKERYDRTLQILGVEPSTMTENATENEMTMIARLASTVPFLVRTSHTDIIDRLTNKVQDEFRRETIRRTEIALEMSFLEEEEEEVKEITSGDSLDFLSKSTEMATPTAMEYVDSATGKFLPARNVIYKKRARHGSQGGSDDEEEEEEEDEQLELQKTASAVGSTTMLLDATDDVLQDILPTDDPLAVVMGKSMEEEVVDPFDDDNAQDWSGLPSEVIKNGKFTMTKPTSLDIDAFIHGHEKYVIDFDKMKKTHIHEWKWVDVAVFDYNPENGKYYVRTIFPPIVHAWVEKIYLCFDGEDPNQHGKRILDTVIRRTDSENTMRFNLYVDCLRVDEFPGIEPKTMDKIVKKATTAPNLKYLRKSVEKMREEIDLEYKRTAAKAKFIRVAEKNGHLYKPWVTIPKHDKMLQHVQEDPELPNAAYMKMHEIISDIPEESFCYKKLRLLRQTVTLGENEPRDALSVIHKICVEAKQKVFILTDLEPMPLREWEELQLNNVTELRVFLDEVWPGEIVKTLKDHLGKIPRSWYNLKESDYDVFEMSKLKNYLMLVKIMMEDTIRSMLIDSLQGFLTILKDLCSKVDFQKRFEWDDSIDLGESQYPTPEGKIPIWTLNIELEGDTARYDHSLVDFSTVFENLFQKIMECVKKMKNLLPRIMPQVRYATRPHLLCPEETEPQIETLYKKIQKYIKILLLPVDSYVFRYSRYTASWNIEDFLKDWISTIHTADEVIEAVTIHKEQKQMYDKQIPLFVDITGVRVMIEALKGELLKKKNNTYTTLLDSHCYRLRRTMERIREEYKEMERQLKKINELTQSTETEEEDESSFPEDEMKEMILYCAAVPLQVRKLQEITWNLIKEDSKVFTKFLFNQPNEDVTLTWETAIYSAAVIRLAKAVFNRLTVSPSQTQLIT